MVSIGWVLGKGSVVSMGCAHFVGFSLIGTKSSMSDSFSLASWSSRVDDEDKQGAGCGEESSFAKYLSIERKYISKYRERTRLTDFEDSSVHFFLQCYPFQYLWMPFLLLVPLFSLDCQSPLHNTNFVFRIFNLLTELISVHHRRFYP